MEQSFDAADRRAAYATLSIHQSAAHRCPDRAGRQRDQLHRRCECDDQRRSRRALQSHQRGEFLCERRVPRQRHQSALHPHSDRSGGGQLCFDRRGRGQQRLEQHFRANRHHCDCRQRPALRTDQQRGCPGVFQHADDI